MDDRNVIRAFTAEQVERITGLSPDQLRDWDNQGFFKPKFAFENRRSPYARIYDFRDVVGLRTLSILRKEHRIPMRHLKDVARELSQYSAAPFSEITLYVFNKEVCFNEPDTGKMRGVVGKQYVASIPLRDVHEDVRRAAAKLKERDSEKIGKVERHRYVAHNSWVVAGTRVPIAAIRRFTEAGYTPAQIVVEYPTLTEADVQAALAHEPSLKLTA